MPRNPPNAPARPWSSCALAVGLLITGCVHTDRSTIVPGQGDGRVRIGDSQDRMLDTLGTPEGRTVHATGKCFSYSRPHWMTVCLTHAFGTVYHLSYDWGHAGQLANGIGPGSPLATVLARSGGARKQVKVPREEDWLHGTDRVLYEWSTGPSGYRFRDACRGIAYDFDGRRLLRRMVVRPPEPLCSCRPRSPAALARDPRRASAIRPDHGNAVIRIGDPVSKVIAIYGQPVHRAGTEHQEKLSYQKRFQVDFLAHPKQGKVLEIRFYPGYGGRLADGTALCSPLKEVLQRNGGTTRTVRAPREQWLEHGKNRVLYELTQFGLLSDYVFRDECRGVLYRFDPADRLVHQIVVHERTLTSCACPVRIPAAVAQDPRRTSAILPDQGSPVVRVGDSVSRVLSIYGQPEVRYDRYGNNAFERLGYLRRFQIDFLARSKDATIVEIRFFPGYGGRLGDGTGLCSSLKEVLARSGGVTKTVRVPHAQSEAHGSDRVLYELTQGGHVRGYHFRDMCRGVFYWFDRVDRRAHQIDVYDATRERGCDCPSPAPDPAQAQRLAIVPVRGNATVKLGDSEAEVLRKLGPFETRSSSAPYEWLTFKRRHGLSVALDAVTRKVGALLFVIGYAGRLPTGIGLCSTLDDVLARSGGAARRVRTPVEDITKHPGDRVLMEVTKEGKVSGHIFTDACRGLEYGFGVDRRVSRIFVTEPAPCPAAGGR